MIEVGNVVAVVAASFALGILWYEFLRRPQKDKLKLTAISFAGVLIGEALVSAGLRGGPAAYGLHPVTALVSSFIAVYLHTAWAEKKVWPWEIIGELDSLKSALETVPVFRISIGSKPAKSTSRSQAQPESREEKKAA